MKYCFFLFLFCFVGFEVKAKELCFDNKTCYNIKIAQEDEDLRNGLMWVEELPSNKGMLFDLRGFDSKFVSMWMKNTFISLDVVFIGCDKVVKDIYKDAKPLSLDRIESDTEFCYVLEINGGDCYKNNIKIGDKVYFDFKLDKI